MGALYINGCMSLKKPSKLLMKSWDRSVGCDFRHPSRSSKRTVPMAVGEKKMKMKRFYLQRVEEDFSENENGG